MAASTPRRLVGLAIAVAAVAVVARAAADDGLRSLQAWRRWSVIHALAQTPDGFLWIAADGALTRFDGTSFVSGPALPDGATPTALQTGADGALWIGLADGGVARLHDGRVTRVPAVRLAGAVTGLAIDPSGRLLVTGGGKSIAVGTSGAPEDLAPLVGDSPVRVVAVGRRGGVFVATASAVVQLGGTPLAARARWPGVDARLLAVDGDGAAWALADRSVHRFDPGGPQRLVRVLPPGFGATALVVDAAGDVWISGGQTNERLRDGTRWIGGRSTRAQASLVDREASLWVGTADGELHRLGVAFVRNFVSAPGRNGEPQPAFGVTSTPDGAVWFAAPTALVRQTGDAQTRWESGKELPAFTPRGLAPAREGGVWLATLDAGLFRFDGRTFAPLPPGRGAIDRHPQAVLEAADGTLWIGYRDGGIDACRPGARCAFQDLGEPRCPPFEGGASTCPTSVCTLAEDAAGGVWVGTFSRGLYHLRSGEPAARVRDVPSRVYGVVADREGVAWVATATGLARVRGDRVALATTYDGLPSQALFGLVDDGAGQLWASTDSGVFRVRKAALEEVFAARSRSVTVYRYGAADGMLSAEGGRRFGPTAVRATDGRLLFATTAGVVVFAAPQTRTAIPAPTVVLESVLADGAAVAVARGLRRAGELHRLDVRYTAPTFAAAHRVVLEHRLDGAVDGQATWQPAGPDRTARFHDLPAGAYTLRLRARLDDEPWASSELALPVVLTSRYLQARFVVTLAAALVALTLRLHVARTRLLRARFAAALAERNRIARDLHDSLAQWFAGMALQLERLRRQPPGSPRAAEVLEQMREMVRVGRADARQAIGNLRHEGAEARGLVTALRETVEQATLAGGGPIGWQVDGEERPVPVGVTEALRRVVQEATTNARQHGHAERVVVTLAFGAAVRVEITDDGSGFDARAAPAVGHFGLQAMRERTAAVGATLDVRPRAEGGTVVSVTWPASPDREESTA